MLPQSDFAPSETKISSAVILAPRGGVVVLHYGLAQEVIALVGAVAHEALLAAHLIRGGLEGLHAGGGQGQSHIAYAELYEPLIRVELRIGGGTAGDLGEKVAAGEFSVVFVELDHLEHLTGEVRRQRR